MTSLPLPNYANARKKRSKDEERKLDQAKVGFIKDQKLAEELIKLVEEKKVSDDLIEQIAGKEIIKPQLTKAELAFKNKQEKMVCAILFALSLHSQMITLGFRDDATVIDGRPARLIQLT